MRWVTTAPTEDRFTPFGRQYVGCHCGGWDEWWVSQDNSLRFVGRHNHRHGCEVTS